MTLNAQLKPALCLQLPHLILSAAWNLAGVVLIAKGLAPLGPTASTTTAILLLLLAAGLLLGSKKIPQLYLIISLVLLVGTLMTIAPAFYKPASLWPSDFWRYVGVALNSVGALGALLGLIKYFKYKGSKK